MFLIRILIRDTRLRQGLLWLLLFAVGFALFGFISTAPKSPSAQSQSRQSQSPQSQLERFPCEDCPCGCSTAEHCWDKCCCYSDREKLAWAARNEVRPPAFLTARVAKSTVGLAQLAAPTCCHCGSKAGGMCDVAAAASSQSLGDETSIQSPDKQPSESPGETSSDSIAKQKSTGTLKSKGILMWKAAECRGIQSFWSLLAAVYVSPVVGVIDIQPAFASRITLGDLHASIRNDQPDPPIP